MRSPETLGVRENPEAATESEQRIIDSLTPAEIELVNGLHVDNLTKRRAGIVGVRSEDLLFLLDSIHKGYIPLGNSEIMAKSGVDHLYLTPNPESAYLREHAPDVIAKCSEETFQKTVRENLSLYSTIAIKQAIYRNVTCGLDEREKGAMIGEFRRNNPCRVDDALCFEDFYKEAAIEVLGNRHPTRFDTGSKPALSALRHSLERKFSPEEAERFLRSLAKRGGISLAFNERLFGKYQRILETDADGRDELVFDIPSEKIDLGADSNREMRFYDYTEGKSRSLPQAA